MTAADATTRERWLLAGQDLLRTGGIVAVKLSALTAASERTTGSFYHHFAGMKAYIAELAAFYGTEQVEANLAELSGDEPRTRIRALMAMATTHRMVSLDAAMRDWAGSNGVAAQAVQAADAHLLGFLTDAFVDLGYDRVGAQVRAHLLLAAGVARVTPPWPVSTSTVDAILAVLSPPADEG